MGVSHKIYVGPYVRCANQLVDRAVRHDLVCQKGCLGSRMRLNVTDAMAKFCPGCGAELVKQPVMGKRKQVDASDLYEEIERDLSNFNSNVSESEAFEDFDVWVPNRAWDFRPDRGVDEHFVGEARIKDSDPPSERVRFEMAFQPAILKLRAAYGDSNVEVLWGVLGKWS